MSASFLDVYCCLSVFFFFFLFVFFFQAEDGIRDLVRSRGLGDVYKRQGQYCPLRPDCSRACENIRRSLICTAEIVAPRSGDDRVAVDIDATAEDIIRNSVGRREFLLLRPCCLLYTSDAADERSSVDLGGRRLLKKKKKIK